MVDEELEYISHDFVNFDDGTYRWIDIKRFALQRALAGVDALQMLLKHERYRDHYMTGNSNEIDSETLHGPYLLTHITPRSFELVDEEGAIDTIRNFATSEGLSTNELDHKLERDVLALIRRHQQQYRLRNLRKETQHELWFVLLDFTELVLIDSKTRSLVLLVAAVD